MNVREIFHTVLANPGILRPPSRNFLLISHMRAHTSLIGHIFGSHPEISGYYEQHIGYYSWRSLIRHRLLFHRRNPTAPVTPIYFDKLLHNYHHVSPAIMQREDVRVLFMLRAPESAIASIVGLYKRTDPDHDWATVEGAAEYYCDRLRGMESLWESASGVNQRLYLDSESLIERTDESLSALSEALGLSPALSDKYEAFALTGKRGFGDSSSAIASGHIVRGDKKPKSNLVPEELAQEAREIYSRVRSRLAENVDPRLLIP